MPPDPLVWERYRTSPSTKISCINPCFCFQTLFHNTGRAWHTSSVYVILRLYTLLVISGLDPAKVFPVYCASKYGVVGFTRSLKDRSESDGVRINALCPGLVDTKLIRDWMEEQPAQMKELFLSNMTKYNNYKK
jgi:NAD(P)-dependent dehydrogenase (short-subunit alcohol dehydrogenase family)